MNKYSSVLSCLSYAPFNEQAFLQISNFNLLTQQLSISCFCQETIRNMHMSSLEPFLKKFEYENSFNGHCKDFIKRYYHLHVRRRREKIEKSRFVPNRQVLFLLQELNRARTVNLFLLLSVISFVVVCFVLFFYVFSLSFAPALFKKFFQ